MTPDALAEMLRRDREEWDTLTAVLDSRPSGALHDAESPSWEARDVYAHLARWIHKSTDDLEAWLDGQRLLSPPEGSDDEINARWQAEDETLSLAEARARANDAFARRLTAIEAVPPDRWDPILEKIAEADGYQHYVSHRRYIEAAQSA